MTLNKVLVAVMYTFYYSCKFLPPIWSVCNLYNLTTDLLSLNIFITVILEHLHSSACMLYLPLIQIFEPTQNSHPYTSALLWSAINSGPKISLQLFPHSSHWFFPLWSSSTRFLLTSFLYPSAHPSSDSLAPSTVFHPSLSLLGVASVLTAWCKADISLGEDKK